jgi:hypothetical protein
MTTPKKQYANETRDTDKSFMDTLTEIGTAVMEGIRGSQRASENPVSESYRAQQRTKQREGKAYGGKAKKKMMCGGKAHGKKK